ncbi:MAG: Gfo/Idh/MocA family oxidoreductase [Candidatus Hydrogenedentes bacterium]|nr:Gfo/Idh/MocA family oxidoreductase [Candidatus Hydrogenedentota bacterium]
MSVSRRKFLGSSAAAVIVAGTVAKGKVFGANDKIRVACIGTGGRGKDHARFFSQHFCTEVTAVCDVNATITEALAAKIKETSGKAPFTSADMREVMNRDDVDAVSTATPNHWHTLVAIWACQAGKDVYVEKPLSHTVWEGRQLVAAQEKYGRIVQHGTQSRSSLRWIRDIKLMRDGIIGDLHTARGTGYKNGGRQALTYHEDSEPPEHLNWPLWQGPVPDHPYNKNYVPYNWHWFWRYGNGEIGNQGVHEMDKAVWCINKGLPVRVYSGGGRYTYKDQGETPNTNTAIFTYADGTEMIFDVRNRFTNREGGVVVGGTVAEDGTITGGKLREAPGCGNLAYGSNGYYVENVGFFDTDDKLIEINEPEPEQPKDANFINFTNAVLSRKPEDNPCDALVGHISCVHCHLANISYRLGRSLNFDPETEKFVGDDEANALLTKEYRKGFEVPQLA